jgi:hypothetical protein
LEDFFREIRKPTGSPKKASRKPPGRYKKFQGRNPEIFWKKLSVHKDILKLTDL